ncbi:hypothetical protein B4168_2248 [Anoxybacillus flavithermus]|nr:hypothetical protein B4168_2248 [Anoxybacillus flavithermus]OAO85902.1 hypothetical protein GT23_2805 [Parageobacillus thermoglucosidasius]
MGKAVLFLPICRILSACTLLHNLLTAFQKQPLDKLKTKIKSY